MKPSLGETPALQGAQGARISWLDLWSDRVWDTRDALLASSRFQRWAAAFPLTRPIVRRRTRALFDVVAGFTYSQVLYACVSLRVFDILAEGPHTIADLSQRIALPVDSSLRLMKAAMALRLVQSRSNGRFGLGPLGAAMVGNPGIAAMVTHHRMLYADLHDPVALLRGTGERALSQYWAYAASDDPASLTQDLVASYTALMAASQSFIANMVLDAVPLDSYRTLLDVGGGNGSFLIEAAKRAAKLRLMLCDLPAVSELARERFTAAGLAGRASVHGVDFQSGSLPAGADIISLVRVLHDHDDAVVAGLLRSVRHALPPGGTILIAEPMSGTRGAERAGDAYFGMYLLAMGSGRPRTLAELGEFLPDAGFDRVRSIPTSNPLLACVLTARVPN